MGPWGLDRDIMLDLASCISLYKGAGLYLAAGRCGCLGRQVPLALAAHQSYSIMTGK
jgi:hypothetical protein